MFILWKQTEKFEKTVLELSIKFVVENYVCRVGYVVQVLDDVDEQWHHERLLVGAVVDC